MRFVSVSYHVPDPEGTAAGRVLHAVVEGLRELGHEATVQSWWPDEPENLPSWCAWTPLPESHNRARLGRAQQLVRPGTDSARLEVSLPSDAIAVAEDPLSFAAIRRSPRTALTIHNLTSIDNRALGHRQPASRRNSRVERRTIPATDVALASSPRVAGSIPARAHVVPLAHPVPEEPFAPADPPVAANVADWRWPPNAWALERLLEAWPTVRDAVPGATLLLAGRGLERVGTIDGVQVLGPVDSSASVLARASVLAFPCPATTGPKIKVLEALMSGLPVVTTPAGVEGLGAEARTGTVVTDLAGFGPALAAALAQPDRRAALAVAARAGALAGHRPQVAARARVAACADVFGQRL